MSRITKAPTISSAVAALLLAAAVNAQQAAPSPIEGDQVLELPPVDTSALEPAVAEQITGLLDWVGQVEAGTPADTKAPVGEAYGRLAMTLHSYRLDEAALVAYENAVRLVPRSSDWIYGRALVESLLGRLESAADTYRQAIGMSPGNLAARVHLAETLMELGRLDEALEVLDTADAVAPGQPSVIAAKGQLALAAERPHEAIPLLHRALELLPQANAIHYPLGLAYRALGDMERAREHLAQRGAVGIKPPDPFADEVAGLQRGERVFLLRGRMALQVGRLEEAAMEFARAAEADPKSSRALVNLSAVLSQLGRLNESAAALERALVIEPENLTAIYNLGSLRLAQGQFPEALPLLQRIVSTSPEDADATLGVAQALRGLGRREDALQFVDRALVLRSDSAAALFERSRLLVELERYLEAKEALELAHALHPTDRRIVYGFARLLSLSPIPALREPAKAVEIAAGMFEALPSESSAELLASAHASNGDCARAAELLDQAAELSDDPATSPHRQRAEQYRQTAACNV